MGLIVGLNDAGQTVRPLLTPEETLLVTCSVTDVVMSVIPLFTGVTLKVLAVPELTGIVEFHR